MNQKYRLIIIDENNEEKIIEVEPTFEDDGNILIDIADELEEIDIKKQTKFIEDCINRVPVEQQTDETLELVKVMFQLKDKD